MYALTSATERRSSGLTVFTSGHSSLIRVASSTVSRIGRPAAHPPACALVRPPNMIAMSVPIERIRVFWSSLKPRPNPTSRITDAMPHTIPNIVKNDRILCARSVARVCFAISRRFMRLSV